MPNIKYFNDEAKAFAKRCQRLEYYYRQRELNAGFREKKEIVKTAMKSRRNVELFYEYLLNIQATDEIPLSASI
jgi:hypothetical protein